MSLLLRLTPAQPYPERRFQIFKRSNTLSDFRQLVKQSR